MRKIQKIGVFLAFLAAIVAVGAALAVPSSSEAQTNGRVGLIGRVECLLAGGAFCITTEDVGHIPSGTLLDSFLGAFPWGNLEGVTELDSVGSADLDAADDFIVADRDDGNGIKRISAGQLQAFFDAAGLSGLTQTQVNALIEGYTGQLSAGGTFARNRLPLATATEPGAVSAADQTTIEALPAQGPGQAGKFFGFDGSGNYAAVDAPAGSGSGTITGVTAGTGLTGGGATGTVELRLEGESFTLAEQEKLAGIADNANDYTLPRNLNAFANDLEGNGYVIQTGAVGNTRTNLAANGPTAATYSYGTAYTTGPRITNNYYYVRIPLTEVANLALYEVRVGETDDREVEQRINLSTGSGVTDLGRPNNLGSWNYYAVLIPDKPAGDSVILVRYDRLSLANVDVPYGLLTGVPAGEGVTFTAADETKLDGIEDNANDYRLPGNIAALADDITGAGYVILPNTVAAIHTANQSNVATAAGYTYGNFYGTGTRETSQFWYFRLPVDTALDGLEARVGDSDNTDIEGRIPAEDWTALGNLGNYDYYAVQIDDKPAGDALIVVQLDKPTLANVEVPYNLLTGVPDSGPLVPAEGSIEPGQLNFDVGKNTPGNAVTVNAAGDGFSSLQLVGQREIFNGSASGVSLFQSLDTASATTTTALTDPLNVNDEGHGLIGGSFALTLVSRTANTVRWDAGGTVEDDPVVNVSGFISLETLASSPNYLSTSSDLGVPLIQQDVYNGSNVRGVLVIRLAHDSAGRVNFNAQYLPDAGFTDTATASVTISGSIVLLATGAPRGESGTGGPVYEFATALPSANDSAVYPDGSLALVYSGAQQGLYRKSSQTTHVKADTGTAGLDVDPTGGSATLESAADGRYTTLYVARTGFSGRGGSSLAANNSRWSAMPAALSHLFLSYRTTTRADGEVEFKYSSARTYTGDIRITAGSLTLNVARIDATTWRLTGLTAAQVAALRENVWRLSEPGQTGTVTVHRWDSVLRPQKVQLFAPASWLLGATFRNTGVALGDYDLYGVSCGGHFNGLQLIDGDEFRARGAVAATRTVSTASINSANGLILCATGNPLSTYFTLGRSGDNYFMTGTAASSGNRSGIRIYGINLN